MTTASNSQASKSQWRLVSSPVTWHEAPVLDASQAAVVDRVAVGGHGPLLLLAGPGTGKTTTVVEAVVARVANGTDPARVLTLTFSRKAAQELRSRLTGRLRQAVGTPTAWTFHAFGYALLSSLKSPDAEGLRPRLFSGPEQDVVVRELIAGSREDASVPWPADLRAALSTRGFADEVRTLISRARSMGLEPEDLAELTGPDHEWRSVAQFLEQYLDNLTIRGALDYSELVTQAVAYAESDAGRASLRGAYDLVVVDEYQDTDPAQERLLQALCGDGRDLLVVGDPDQSIYAFRGAEVRGLLDFRERFRRASADGGGPAQVLTLRVSRRAGPVLLDASRRVAGRLTRSGAGLAQHLREHRDVMAAPGLADGSVEVFTAPSAGAEVDFIADLLRREHLESGTAWSQMAVLVRSGVHSLPGLRRALGSAGVPVEVAGDEVPLALEPAVAPLLLALDVVDRPDALTPDVARALLTSPLGGADPSGLRRLGRALREEERSALTRAGRTPMPRSSAVLIAEAVAAPERLVAHEDRWAAPARRVGQLLHDARGVVAQGGSVHDALWALWTATPWPNRLEAAALAGGAAGRAADRDLDAVVALFEAAQRADVAVGHRGVGQFLAELQAQQIPGDTLTERGIRPDAVRLLTAHRSKGLEWDVVVVASVQAEAWPDLRRRGSLLEPDRLGVDGLREPAPVSALLEEERRLFYVACTRARRRLVVTAVNSPEDDGARPSRFLAELSDDVAALTGPPRRPLTLSALVAHLRATATDPGVTPGVRDAAVQRLALLARLTVSGQPLAPAADPDRWWGVAQTSAAPDPMFPDDQPLRISPTSLEALAQCPLNWFLDHEARARSAQSVAQGFGRIIHTLAERLASDSPPTTDQMLQMVDDVWDQLDFAAVWQSHAEREVATQALQRLVSWHEADRGRSPAGAEVRFSAAITVADRPVQLIGRMDRVEIDADGRVVVVDLKTSRKAPGPADVANHLQLGLYQQAVLAGAVPDVDSTVPGGAELVMVRLDDKSGGPVVKVQPPLVADAAGGTAITEALSEAVGHMVAEDFPPIPGRACHWCDFTASCPTKDIGRQVVS
jgi:superfamily I DNA/RNA helicase/RecB family exonuclease